MTEKLKKILTINGKDYNIVKDIRVHVNHLFLHLDQIDEDEYRLVASKEIIDRLSELKNINVRLETYE